ncbi:MAG: GAF and ANTAR domain-containing protein [Actinobacteria bacterium]|nr:GAF and ANTAR domain-containing protein [Actinomycetota bacterium]
MQDQDPLRQGLMVLSQFFVGDQTLSDTLTRVAQLANDTIPASEMAGITMLVEGKPTTAVFTDEAAPEIDCAQYATGIGPCLDAFRYQKVLRIDDTEKDERWASFSEAAAARGIRSTLSLPLTVNHEGIGALNLYSRTESGFGDHDVEVGAAFATQAAIVLANAQAYWDAFQLGVDLRTAMQSRAVIEQAKGILMAMQRCSADEAFQILVRASQRENRKLREMAEELVETNERRAGDDRRK